MATLRRALVAACALNFLGCGTHSARLTTVDQLPDVPRRAPGVAVDPAPELPAPADRAPTEQAVVVVSAPPSADRARDLIKSFLRAAVNESAGELERLLADRAWVRTPAGQRQSARSFWRERLRRLDYGSLAQVSLYRDDEIETFRASDAERLRSQRGLSVVPAPQELVVRVRLLASRNTRQKLFGDELVFVLRSDSGTYKITEIVEDFQLP